MTNHYLTNSVKRKLKRILNNTKQLSNEHRIQIVCAAANVHCSGSCDAITQEAQDWVNKQITVDMGKYQKKLINYGIETRKRLLDSSL